MTKDEELESLCKKFIEDNKIYSAETIYQADRVIENAYFLIEDICKILGFATPDY